MIIPAIQIPAVVVEGITLEDTIVCGMGVGELVLEGIQLEELYTLDVEIEDQAICPIDYTPPPPPLPDPRTYLSRLYPIYVDEAVASTHSVEAVLLKDVVVLVDAVDSVVANSASIIAANLKNVVVRHDQLPEDGIQADGYSVVSANLVTAIAYIDHTVEPDSLKVTGYAILGTELKTIVVTHPAETESLKVTGYSVISCALVTE